MTIVNPRLKDDCYYTPEWVTHSLLDWKPELIFLNKGRWFEPMCGDGSIIKAVRSYSEQHWPHCPPYQQFFCSDIRREVEPQILQLTRYFLCSDFLKLEPGPMRGSKKQFDILITNPTYAIAHETAKHALKFADTVILLLRLGFAASQERQTFLKQTKPDIGVLSKRPSFVQYENSSTDRYDNAWFCWGELSSGLGLWEPIGPIDDKYK